jgi:hypothetical protein
MKAFDIRLQGDAYFRHYLMISKVWCQQHHGGVGWLWPAVDIYGLSFAEIDRLNRLKELQIETDGVVRLVEVVGRVLVLYPQQSLNDGMMCTVADGLIDVDDLPPWATWFYYAPDAGDDDGVALYAWIPEAFVSGVQQAMDVDAYNCLRWL